MRRPQGEIPGKHTEAQNLLRRVVLPICTIYATCEGSGEKAAAKQNARALCECVLFNWPLPVKLPDPERHSLSVSLETLLHVFVHVRAKAKLLCFPVLQELAAEECEGPQVCSDGQAGMCVCVRKRERDRQKDRDRAIRRLGGGC